MKSANFETSAEKNLGDNIVDNFMIRIIIPWYNKNKLIYYINLYNKIIPKEP
ncbi:hypothetical protein ACSHT4_04400 [Clostridium botulinum]|uniref:hypothetical protein n=1 Tax=Clostridium botulinum TaxID=1491 RepID=UPI000AB02EA7|nr:hypothetical protein [Clostridium botulinum]HBJ1680382.1 hypothetical protein [Clostridium botulinum]HDI3016832.1 hypothetical protein [Clostridium botulinum]